MKRMSSLLFLSGIMISLQAMQKDGGGIFGELQHVVVDVQQSGAVPKVLAEAKDIYSTLLPIIQNIQKDRAVRGATQAASQVQATTTAPTTSTSTATTTSTTTTMFSPALPMTVAGQTVPVAVVSAQGTDTKSDKGKEKDSLQTPVPVELPIATMSAVSENFTANDLWDLLEIANPVVYQFGKSHNISAHDLLVYAHLLQQYHLEPAAIVAFIKSHNNLDDTKANGWAVDDYADIKKNDPPRYQMFMLAVMKVLFDQANGVHVPSVLNSTHIDLLHDKVSDQQSSIQLRNGGLLTTILGWIGTLAWAAYLQYVQSHSHAAPLNGTVIG